MPTTNQPTPALLGNLFYQINENKFVGLEERDNLVHAFLNDCAFYLNQQKQIKTAVRTYDDEFFNLQLFTETDGYELLITYYPVETQEDFKINDCNGGEIKFQYEVYYKMEAKDGNKNRLKEASKIVNMLMCKNFNNAQDWIYTDTLYQKTYSTITNNNMNNQLLSESPQFSKIQESNFLFFKQIYSFTFSYKKVFATI